MTGEHAGITGVITPTNGTAGLVPATAESTDTPMPFIRIDMLGGHGEAQYVTGTLP